MLGFDFAHNDYLQLFAELGLVGFSIGAALFGRIVHRALKAVKQLGPEAYLPLLGCLGAMTAIGFHSLVDFNLYIPANATVLAWIAGVAVGITDVAPGSRDCRGQIPSDLPA